MQHSERASPIRLHQHQRILSFGNIRQFFLHVSRGVHRMTIYFSDYVSALQSSIVG